ncbi:MAG TPA: hypothetical protein VGR64_06215 [Terracidiphilus sp.]|nr:hypothetical protein [Terracidiphilus sp.]
MGAWGTGVFQDDLACDIRDSYLDFLGDGLSGTEASARILVEYKSSLDDPEDSLILWFALASVEWKHGRLQQETLRQALRAIDSGANLNRWSKTDRNLRSKALEKLRAQITSPQPAAKRVRKRVVCECDWKVGTLVALTLESGRYTVLRVIGLSTDRGGTYPTVELLDWAGDEIPPDELLKQISLRASRPDRTHPIKQVMIVGMGKRAASRLRPLPIDSEPAQKKGPSTVVHWKHIGSFLKEWFLLE